MSIHEYNDGRLMIQNILTTRNNTSIFSLKYDGLFCVLGFQFLKASKHMLRQF
jgi:hypothetical protein